MTCTDSAELCECARACGECGWKKPFKLNLFEGFFSKTCRNSDTKYSEPWWVAHCVGASPCYPGAAAGEVFGQGASRTRPAGEHARTHGGGGGGPMVLSALSLLAQVHVKKRIGWHCDLEGTRQPAQCPAARGQSASLDAPPPVVCGQAGPRRRVTSPQIVSVSPQDGDLNKT